MQWVLQLIVGFLLKQIAAFGAGVNWAGIKADVVAAVNAHLPLFAQPLVDAYVDQVITAMSVALADSADLAVIVADLTAENWSKAVTDLAAMLEKIGGFGSTLAVAVNKMA